VDAATGHQRVRVHYVAADEARDGIVSRLGQMECETRGDLEDEDISVSGPAWERVAVAITETVPDLTVWDPYCDDHRLEEILTFAARQARDEGARLMIFVDSIQTAPFDRDAPDHGAREKSIREQTEGRVKYLRAYANREGACVVLISELSRAGYSKGNKAGMEHLRESGKLEFGADFIAMLKRVRTEDESDFIVEVSVEKNRMGDAPAVFRVKRTDRCTFEPAELPDHSAEADDNRARKLAADEAKVREFVPHLVRALRQSSARITKRDGLNTLLRGKGAVQTLVVKVVSAAINGRHIVKRDGFYRPGER
jgi:plastocyanin